MRNEIRISVVVPVKDRKLALIQTIQSISVQTCKPAEVIIVDDASAEKVAMSWFSNVEINHLKIIRNHINLGAAGACNRGLECALGNIVALLDSDDCYDPRYIERITEFWRRSSTGTVCLVSGFWWCTDELVPYRRHIVRGPVERADLLERGNFLGGNSVISMRREQALEVGGLPNLRGASDWALLLLLAQKGTIETISEPLVLYRSPSASKLSNDTRNFRRQVMSLKSIVESLCFEDQIKARRVLYQHACISLANLGKRRACVRLICGYNSRYGFSKFWLLLIPTLLLGPGFTQWMLREAAYKRALLMGFLLYMRRRQIG